jgi:hypothetical protein
LPGSALAAVGSTTLAEAATDKAAAKARSFFIVTSITIDAGPHRGWPFDRPILPRDLLPTN